MIDIMLGDDYDILLTEWGDINLTRSIKQNILIRLKWFFQEWRLGPELGFPWFEEVLIKNPNMQKIKGLIQNTILDVDGVTRAKVDKLDYDQHGRKISIHYTAEAQGSIIREDAVVFI